MAVQVQNGVVHFVTGGFSGATMVARQLVAEANRAGGEPHLLVLRRKRQTRPAQLDELTQQQIPFYLVPGWSHVATIVALVTLLKRLQPRVLIAHGFSEHLWGRIAAIIAGVPVIIHVEHNSRERYTPWRLWLAKQLTRRTRWLVGVSEGVKNSLLELGFAPEKCVFVNNGIDAERFAHLPMVEFSQRKNAVIMCARFARQKDHETLIRAVAQLKQQGVKIELALLGGGKQSLQKRAQQLVHSLGISEQVVFLGHSNQVPQLLATYQIAALITHYEGMPLALVEAMAAGCAVVASSVVGVKEILARGLGVAVAPKDVNQLAQVLAELLEDCAKAERLGNEARAYALEHFTQEKMLAGYLALIQ